MTQTWLYFYLEVPNTAQYCALPCHLSAVVVEVEVVAEVEMGGGGEL